MTGDPYAGEAGASLRKAETATTMATTSDKLRANIPWWQFERRRTMKRNADFWAAEALRFLAESARIDGDL